MYTFKILLVSISLLLVVGFAKAETIHVDDDNSSGPWDGTQEHPYQYIQDGIDDASYGDTVLAADGIYSGDGNIDLDFKGKAITVASKNGATATIIDCEQLGRGFYFHSGETSSSIVSGFTITNGSTLDAHRGAICCVNSSGPTIENNVITGNNGGGIYCNLESSPSIRDNTISQNSATFGGAICSAGRSRPVIHENRIYENWASDSGGGIYVTGRSYVEIWKNEIIGNVADNMGGGICAWDSPTTVSGNIIVGNSARGQGGGIRYHEFTTSPPTIAANNVIARNSASKGAGIFYQGAFSPAIVNNSIIGNMAGAEGGGIYIEAAAIATVLNTIVWANSPDGISFHIRTWVDVSHSNTQEIWPGDGNISVDPLFVDAENDDYHLAEGSLCIAAGIMTPGAPDTDIEGNPRPNPPNSNPDMGAYENPMGDELLPDANDGAPMALISAGEFLMGSNDGNDDEKPEHTVYLDSFYIDIYEVTNAQYKEFMDATGYSAPKNWDEPRFNAPDLPVVGVTWRDAVSYATWAGKRLPTEAEWEKAARGGLVGKKYPWGDSFSYDYANGGGSSWNGPSPVGSLLPNGYGLYDMAGNVKEWCSDWYSADYYSVSPYENPTGPEPGTGKIQRGGTWRSNIGQLSTYWRNGKANPDSDTGLELGFRCAASFSPIQRTIGMTSAQAAPGATITIHINTNDAAGIAGGDILVKYDTNMVTIDDIRGADLVSGMSLMINETIPGEIMLAMAGTEGIPSDSGALVEIDLTVSIDAQIGTETTLYFGDSAVYDELGNTMPANFESGMIQIIGIKGDVNTDGEVRSNDAILTLRFASGLMVPTEYQEWAADMNEDGKIGSNDSILILRVASGLAAPSAELLIAPSRYISISLAESHDISRGNIAIPVITDSAAELFGGDILIRYDSSSLRAVNVVSHTDGLMVSNTNVLGVVRISFAGIGRLHDSAIATINFDTLSADHTQPILQIVDLYDRDARPIDVRVIDMHHPTLLPEHTKAFQNYPNPFNPDTWMPYQLNEASNVVISIYDVTGKLIRNLDLGYRAAGTYLTQSTAAYWDGRNETGETMASGVYFAVLEAGEYRQTRRMILLK